MPKAPSIPHETIVAYIQSGRSTSDAKEYFGFANENIANLRIHSAFKKLGLVRPRYAETRTCEYCGTDFVARDKKQKSCGSKECQIALIKNWHANNPESRSRALAKYRTTEKGKDNNLRMHTKRRDAGQNGTSCQKWNFAAMEATKRLRKLKELIERNPWEYRVTHIQKLLGMPRVHNPRSLRSFTDNASGTDRWHAALRAVQTTLLQRSSASTANVWEIAVVQIVQAIRSGTKVRSWKAHQKNR